MLPLNHSDVLRIFEQLSGHRGCTEMSLKEAERRFCGKLPPTYRRLMLLDARRLQDAGVCLLPDKLIGATEEARHMLIEDGFTFRLGPQQVVFAWNDIFSFYFCDATGSDSVRVFEFDYYSGGNDRTPQETSQSVPDFLIERIRNYLRL